MSFRLPAKKLNVSIYGLHGFRLLICGQLLQPPGKPWWWILLMFIPIRGPFIGIYLWMCITENLGKKKMARPPCCWVPIAGFVWMGILAFSKSEKYRGLQSVTPHPRGYTTAISKNKQTKRSRRHLKRLVLKNSNLNILL